MPFLLTTVLLALSLHCVSGVTEEEKSVSVPVKEGGSVTLNTSVSKQHHDTVRWYFNDILIAQINGDASTSCLYDGEDGRFRDRVEVDYDTGSLTITNIRSEHAERYEAHFIQSKSSGTSQSLNRTRKCDSTKIIYKNSNMGDTIQTFSVTVSDSNKDIKDSETDKTVSGSDLSAGAVAGIVFAVLLVCVAAAAGVIYYRHRSSRNR